MQQTFEPAIDLAAFESFDVLFRTAPQVAHESGAMDVFHAVFGVKNQLDERLRAGHLSEMGAHRDVVSQRDQARQVIEQTAERLDSERAKYEETRAAIEAGRRFRNPETGNFETRPALSRDVVDVIQREALKARFLALPKSQRHELVFEATKTGDARFLQILEEAEPLMPILDASMVRLIAEWRWRSSGWADTYERALQGIAFAERAIEKARAVLRTNAAKK